MMETPGGNFLGAPRGCSKSHPVGRDETSPGYPSAAKRFGMTEVGWSKNKKAAQLPAASDTSPVDESIIRALSMSSGNWRGAQFDSKGS